MRKQIILGVVTLVLINTAYAFSWQDFWWRPDQQGQRHMAKGEYKKAANAFSDPNWSAVAHYRAGEYQKSIEKLKPLKTAKSYYNQGNALAHTGNYQAAIDAYKQALALEPNNEDAKFNKALLEKLLKQNKQNKNQQQSSHSQSQQKQSQNNQQNQQNKQDKRNQQSQNDQQNSQDKNQSSKQDKEKQQAKQDQPQDDKQNRQQQAQSQQQAEKNAAKKWLSQIPDAPNGLLRQKFLRDYLKQRNLQ